MLSPIRLFGLRLDLGVLDFFFFCFVLFEKLKIPQYCVVVLTRVHDRISNSIPDDPPPRLLPN